jgi:hypothetical protein
MESSSGLPCELASKLFLVEPSCTSTLVRGHSETGVDDPAIIRAGILFHDLTSIAHASDDQNNMTLKLPGLTTETNHFLGSNHDGNKICELLALSL